MTSLSNLNLVNFPDCPINAMSVSTDKKQVAIQFAFIQIQSDAEDWVAVDDATLTITNWDSLLIYKFDDDSWETVNTEDLEIFKEILEVEQHTTRIMLEGFSAQSGYWLRYEFAGNSLNVVLEAEALV